MADQQANEASKVMQADGVPKTVGWLQKKACESAVEDWQAQPLIGKHMGYKFWFLETRCPKGSKHKQRDQTKRWKLMVPSYINEDNYIYSYHPL